MYLTTYSRPSIIRTSLIRTFDYQINDIHSIVDVNQIELISPPLKTNYFTYPCIFSYRDQWCSGNRVSTVLAHFVGLCACLCMVVPHTASVTVDA